MRCSRDHSSSGRRVSVVVGFVREVNSNTYACHLVCFDVNSGLVGDQLVLSCTGERDIAERSTCMDASKAGLVRAASK